MKRALLTISLAALLLITAACDNAANGGSDDDKDYVPGEELLKGKRQGHSVRPNVMRPTKERMAQLKLPDGFKISLFATGLGRPRMLLTLDDGTILVSRRRPGDVLAVKDTDGDGKADKIEKAIPDLEQAHGLAVHDNKLYIGTIRKIYVADVKDGKVGKPRVLIDDLPKGGRHPNRTLGIGPDKMLYISVGSTCNCCVEPNEESATVLRSTLDGKQRIIFSRGLRNTVGFDWHPKTGQLWGMDHGTDWLGDNEPPEELNLLEKGNDYGWPFVYGDRKTIPLKSHPKVGDLSEYAKKTVTPVLGYTAHAAPIEMEFYDAEQFPEEYRGDAFIAMHGSWNRKPPAGYEVVRVKFDDKGKPVKFEKFLTGFKLEGMDEPAVFGRPAGLTIAKDGSLLVGDDNTGVIYRIEYVGKDG
ncbi:MAG: PQQ-dependent sugar dehydrogenase [Phycisphaerae bacterium]